MAKARTRAAGNRMVSSSNKRFILIISMAFTSSRKSDYALSRVHDFKRTGGFVYVETWFGGEDSSKEQVDAKRFPQPRAKLRPELLSVSSKSAVFAPGTTCIFGC